MKTNTFFWLLVGIAVIFFSLAVYRGEENSQNKPTVKGTKITITPTRTPSPSPSPTIIVKIEKKQRVIIMTPVPTTISPTSSASNSTNQSTEISVQLSINLAASFSVTLPKDSNQCDVLNEALKKGKISSLNMKHNAALNTYGVYQINGIGQENQVWWTYKVNGTSPSEGCSYIKAQNNDSVVWSYIGPN